jgi:hypothetical protein
MVNTKSDFEVRKKEIENYFSFLEILDKDETVLKYVKNGKITEEEISKDIQRILIANSFLILYNLIESTVRNSILAIYEKIKEDEVNYTVLSSNLKKIWLQKKTKNLNKSNLEEIIKSVVENEIIALTQDDINISGNIDAEKIRGLAKEIGFEKSNNERNGQNLVTIKNKRNGLAHGNHTFYDVGKDYTVNDINRYKQETFEYLSEVITNIEIFITTKKYTVNPINS